MENCCRKLLFCDTEPVSQEGIVFRCGDSAENCDGEPVWRTVTGRYCFVIHNHGGELLQ